MRENVITGSQVRVTRLDSTGKPTEEPYLLTDVFRPRRTESDDQLPLQEFENLSMTIEFGEVSEELLDIMFGRWPLCDHVLDSQGWN